MTRTTDKPRNLHVTHNWPGGSSSWIERFARADPFSENLVLRSIGSPSAYGIAFRLGHVGSEVSLAEEVLQHPICELVAEHQEYRRLLLSICRDHAVEHIYVSSLAGHSLDVYGLGVPSTQVHHDYFPYCPAFHLTRHRPCTCCTPRDLTLCRRMATGNRPKAHVGYYPGLRDAWFDSVRAAAVRHVAPSPTVIESYCRLDDRFRSLPIEVIGHGLDWAPRDCFGGATEGRRLRVGVLGRLAPHKGLETVVAGFDLWRSIVDLYLVGCGDSGTALAGRRACQVVPLYEEHELPEILEELRLDLVLLPHVTPETFSYTLSEAWCFGVPAAARRIGAPAARITHGRDGFLFGTDDGEIVDLLLRLDRARGLLRRAASRVRAKPLRSTRQEVLDYYQLRRDHSGRFEPNLEVGRQMATHGAFPR